MKRTTLIIDASIHAELKKRAAAEGRTLGEIVERALRMGLQAASSARRSRIQLPSYDLGPYLTDPASREEHPSAEPEEPGESR